MGMKHLNQVSKVLLSTGVLLSTLFLATSCTRDLPDTTATIKLGLPSTNKFGKALSVGDKLSHVIINVTGPGIAAPVFISWDGKDGNSVAPTSFVVDIPTGSARLFQALLVYEDTLTGATSFYYGDIEQAVDSSTNSVTVVASSLPNTSSGDGHISGRMLPAGTPYTGKVSMRFAPASGRPPMLIETSEIFAGWFNVFGLDGIAFNYTLDDGTEFFGSAVDVGAFAGSISVGHLDKIAVSIPDHFQSHGSPSDPREPRKGSVNVYGWFGAGASSKYICYDSANIVDLDGAYTDSNTSNTIPIQWDSNGSAAYARRMSGGVAESSIDGDGLCNYSSSVRFTDLLSVIPKSVGHSDSALGFRGPFSRVTYSGPSEGYLDYFYDADTVTLDWAYLPGVAESAGVKGVAGSDIFMRILPVGADGQDVYGNNHSLKCSALPMLGFAYKGSVPVATVTADIDTSAIGGYGTADASNRAQWALCPYSLLGGVKSYYNTGLTYGGQGGGGPGPVQVQFSSPTSSVMENVAGGYAYVNVMLTSPSASPVTVNYAVSGGTAVSSLDYTPVSGTLTFSPGTISTSFSVPLVNDGTGEGAETIIFGFSANIGASIGTTSSHTLTINDDDGVTPNISINDPTAVIEGSPVQFVVTIDSVSGSNVTFDYYTFDGMATTAGSDYTQVFPTTATIPAGQTSVTLPGIATNDDALIEITETFSVTLISIANANAGDVNGLATINDNESLPMLTIDNPTAVTEGASITFYVSLSAARSSGDVVFTYATSDNTATVVDSDYTPVTSQFTIPAGQSNLPLPFILTAPDGNTESTECFYVTLSGYSNASAGALVGVGCMND